MKQKDYFLKYNSSPMGLSSSQVLINRKLFGDNIVTSKKRNSFFYILLIQFGNLFSIILSIAGIVLFLLGEFVDMYVVLFVILINVLLESIQRYKSDSILESLTKVLPSTSLVLRDKKRIRVHSNEIVVGDIVYLQSGEKISADGIILYSENVRVDESILTGESRSISKSASEEYDTNSIIENKTMLFCGTHVVSGTATMLVLEIGNKTQIGQIAKQVSSIDMELPLYKDIKKLSFNIFIFVLISISVLFVVGIVNSQPYQDLFKTSVALLVSAIPESLPVLITLILAYGFKRMSEKNVLIRKMHSLDVLGKINILALDKTGTITHNQMKVEKIFTFLQEVYVSGNGYEPKGVFISNNTQVQIETNSDIETLIRMSVLSSDGSYYFDEEKKDWVLESGDPTEVSLLVLGEKLSQTKQNLSTEYVVKENIPFTNQTKYHTGIYLHNNKIIKIHTGASEIIYHMCTHVRVNGQDKKIDKNFDFIFKQKITEYSKQGYRSLASCIEENNKIIFLGIFAIQDSIRSDIVESIQKVYERGIDIIMITGDHRDVALQVAQKIGIHANEHTVLTGDDMSNLTELQIENIIISKNVFARVTPTQKLKILEILKRLGKTVAMTGDGVNDTLALARADIGIAMGTISSDTAKETADIILLNNSFGSIVYGIDEGENIFTNIRKTILFLLSTNFAEMFVVIFAVLFMLPLPLSATGILWLNLVTDTFLVIGFTLERNCKQCNSKGQKIISVHDWKRIVYLGVVMTCISLIIFMTNQSRSIAYAQSITLLVIIIMQWFNILNIRAGDESIFSYGFKINSVFIIGWILSVMCTVFAFLYVPLRDILHIHPITLGDWVYVIIIACSIILFEEIRKQAQKTKLFLRK